MRRFVLVCFLISAASTTACVVGEVPPGDDSSAGTDGDDDPGPGPDADPGTCEPASVTLPNGNHNAGLACLSCHTGAGLAPKWTLAGTLYASSSGGTAIPGATVTVVDAAGIEHKLITAANGNFYTNAALQFPVRVTASKCPDAKPMTGAPQSGDCNGCHSATAAQGRIHLP